MSGSGSNKPTGSNNPFHKYYKSIAKGRNPFSDAYSILSEEDESLGETDPPIASEPEQILEQGSGTAHTTDPTGDASPSIPVPISDHAAIGGHAPSTDQVMASIDRSLREALLNDFSASRQGEPSSSMVAASGSSNPNVPTASSSRASPLHITATSEDVTLQEPSPSSRIPLSFANPFSEEEPPEFVNPFDGTAARQEGNLPERPKKRRFSKSIKKGLRMAAKKTWKAVKDTCKSYPSIISL